MILTFPPTGPQPAPLPEASQGILICHHRTLDNAASVLGTCFMAKEVHCRHLTMDPWSCHTLQLPEAVSLTEQWTEGQQTRRSEERART